jgi:hypothetical protein
MSDNRGPYKVYHLNRYVTQFDDRDAALLFVYAQKHPEDHEILDRSDEE